MENELPPGPIVPFEPSPEAAAPPKNLAWKETPAPATPDYTDRRTALIVFGVFQIILGLLAALLVPFVVLGAFLSRTAPGGAQRPSAYVSAILSYVLISAALIILGVGSIKMKRWARALTLITSCYWLFIGALTTVLLTAVLPVTTRTALRQAQQNSAGATPEISTAIMAVIVTVIIAFLAFFMIVVPLAFVIFYARRDVDLTCRHRDPVERWTDRTPLPVLAGSVLFLVGAIYFLLVGITTPIFPFFGRYLTGISGGLCFIVMAGLDSYLAVAFYRLRNAGWWTAIVVTSLHLISSSLTYWKADLMQAYSRIGMSVAQINMLNSNPMFRDHILVWWGSISAIAFFGYVLWLKRYFKTPPPQSVEVLAA